MRMIQGFSPMEARKKAAADAVIANMFEARFVARLNKNYRSPFSQWAIARRRSPPRANGTTKSSPVDAR